MGLLVFAIASSTLNSTVEYTKPSVAEAYIAPEPLDEVASNCYLYVKSRIPRLPRTKDLIANSIYPHVGGVTILDYNGVSHYVFNEQVGDRGIKVTHTNFGLPGYYESVFTWEYLKSHNAIYHRPEESE